MREVASLLNDMVEARIIHSYALFGAVAQMRYTQAAATMDADVLIVTLEADRIDMLGAVDRYCQSRGYMPEGEAIRVGEWPVQFIPVFNAVTEEAVRHAEIGEIDGVPVRVVAADYLAVIALATGRPKDHARILALLDADATVSSRNGRGSRRGSWMIDIEALFARQAARQQSRTRLPWSEKLRQALVLREAQLALRDTSRLPRTERTAPRDAAGRKKNP